MWALAQSGVSFRTIVYEDGTIESELPIWEVPKRARMSGGRERRIGSRGRRRRLPIWRRRCVS
jgi:hypothetical protein